MHHSTLAFATRKRTALLPLFVFGDVWNRNVKYNGGWCCVWFCSTKSARTSPKSRSKFFFKKFEFRKVFGTPESCTGVLPSCMWPNSDPCQDSSPPFRKGSPWIPFYCFIHVMNKRRRNITTYDQRVTEHLRHVASAVSARSRREIDGKTCVHPTPLKPRPSPATPDLNRAPTHPRTRPTLFTHGYLQTDIFTHTHTHLILVIVANYHGTRASKTEVWIRVSREWQAEHWSVDPERRGVRLLLSSRSEPHVNQHFMQIWVVVATIESLD